MIDATVIIQICNFLAVWACLYILVLQKIFGIVNCKNAEQSRLEEVCAQLNTHIEALHHARSREWGLFHMQSKSMRYHATVQKKIRIDYAGIPTPSLTQDGIPLLVHQLTKIIVHRVGEKDV